MGFCSALHFVFVLPFRWSLNLNLVVYVCLHVEHVTWSFEERETGFASFSFFLGMWSCGVQNLQDAAISLSSCLGHSPMIRTLPPLSMMGPFSKCLVSASRSCAAMTCSSRTQRSGAGVAGAGVGGFGVGGAGVVFPLSGGPSLAGQPDLYFLFGSSACTS